MSLKTFKSQLKAKLKTLGVNNLSNERIDAYAATLHKRNPDLKDEDTKEHDDKIDELHEVVDFAKVAKDDDRVRTLETKLKEKEKPAPPKEEEEEEEEEETPPASGKSGEPKKKKERVPSYVKTIMEKLEKLENEKKVSTIESKIKSHEKMKDIPEDFYEDYVKPEKEEDIDAFAEKVSTKYSTYKQVQNNTKAAGSTKPVNGQVDTKNQADVKEVDKVLDSIMPGTKAPETVK